MKLTPKKIKKLVKKALKDKPVWKAAKGYKYLEDCEPGTAFEIEGKGAYGILKNESGVHRLVRLSPFNAKKLRHTSFSLVEIVPKLKEVEKLQIPDDELEIHFARSSGPGGQNVNKRETAVRLTHTPSGISVHVDSERSQAQNREKALSILHGKLYKKKEEDA